MLLERRFGNALNIKDLIIETPQREQDFLFDPERDLTKEDWERMKGKLSEDCGQDELFLLSEYMALFPEWKDELGIEGLYPEIKKRFEEDWANKNVPFIVCMAALIKRIFPGEGERIHFNDPFWEDIRNYDWNKDDSTKLASFLCQKYMKVIFPSFDLDHEVEQGAKNDVTLAEKDEDWEMFAEQAALLKLFSKLGRRDVSRKAWDGMKNALARFRDDGEIESFVNLASNMKILAAEEVRATDKGFEIIMQEKKKEFHPPAPSLPEVKNF